MGLTSNNKYQVFDKIYSTDKRVQKNCSRCGKPFKNGDLVFKKRTKVMKPYHKECWESLLIS